MWKCHCQWFYSVFNIHWLFFHDLYIFQIRLCALWPQCPNTPRSVWDFKAQVAARRMLQLGEILWICLISWLSTTSKKGEQALGVAWQDFIECLYKQGPHLLLPQHRCQFQDVLLGPLIRSLCRVPRRARPELWIWF